MIKLELAGDIEDFKKLLRESDNRVTAFYKGFAITAAKTMMTTVASKIPLNEHPLAMQYRRSLQALSLRDASTNVQDDRGEIKKMARQPEAHYACAMLSVDADASQQPDTTIIKVQARRGERPAMHVWLLSKFGPWTPSTIPMIPSAEEAIVSYHRVDQKTYDGLDQRNKKSSKYVIMRLRALGMYKAHPGDVVFAKGKESIFQYALAKEFGIGGMLKQAWKPAYKFLNRDGIKYILKNEQRLLKALFDPKFTGYRSLERTLATSKRVVYTFKDFQETIMGEVGGEGEPNFIWDARDPLV